MRWKDQITVDVSDTKISFSAFGTSVFDIVFEKCNGVLLGTYNGTPIYAVFYDDLSDNQVAMREDVNVIVQHLLEDEQFVINVD